MIFHKHVPEPVREAPVNNRRIRFEVALFMRPREKVNIFFCQSITGAEISGAEK
jgi:hypothetical protein